MNIDPQKVQAKIKHIVSEYKRLFGPEYQSFLEGMKAKKALNPTKHGVIKGNDMVERALTEWPDTLDRLLKWQLTEEEFAYIADSHSKAGIRWMAKEFPEFRIPENV